MTNIARGWLVQDMTGSAFMVTTVNAMGMVPVLAFSLLGGVIADRMNRRLILIASDAFNLLVLLALALLVVTDVVRVWHVFALSLLHGVGFSLGMPARTATVSNLVSADDMASGVSLFSTIFSAGQLVGPALAGYLINAYGMGAAFIAACSTIAPALVLLAVLRVRRPEPGREASAQVSVLRSIGQGFGYVRQRSVLVGLMLMGLAITVFAMPYQAILPVFAGDVLEVGPSGLGWLGAMGGVGAIAGSITVASFSAPRQMKALMIASGLGLGVFIALVRVLHRLRALPGLCSRGGLPVPDVHHQQLHPHPDNPAGLHTGPGAEHTDDSCRRGPRGHGSPGNGRGGDWPGRGHGADGDDLRCAASCRTAGGIVRQAG